VRQASLTCRRGLVPVDGGTAAYGLLLAGRQADRVPRRVPGRPAASAATDRQLHVSRGAARVCSGNYLMSQQLPD
jgi:hypothetical protein